MNALHNKNESKFKLWLKKGNSMKKLTSLQILMLMSLAVGSSHMHGSFDQDEAMQSQLKSVQDESATTAVLADLAASQPEAFNRIIEDEANLETTFNSLKRFIEKKNKEIEKLEKAKFIQEAEVARLAVELADAQAALEKTIARQRSTHKHDHRHEQAIKDALMKAEQGVKRLSEKALSGLKIFGNDAYEKVNEVSQKIKRSKTGKSIAKVSADAGRVLMEAGNDAADAAIDAGKSIANASASASKSAVRYVSKSAEDASKAVVDASEKVSSRMRRDLVNTSNSAVDYGRRMMGYTDPNSVTIQSSQDQKDSSGKGKDKKTRGTSKN